MFAHREEFLRRRTTHRAGHRRHDHIVELHAIKRVDVRLTVRHVRRNQTFVGDIERIGILHHEFTTTQDARTRTRFIAVLRLDLVDVQRQILVRRVLALHHQGEHLFVRRTEQNVVALAVLQAEQVVAVFGPSVGPLICITRQQCREVHFLEAGTIHFLAHDPLNIAEHEIPERQPREDARRDPTNEAGTRQQLVTRHNGVGRILTQGAQEIRGQAKHAVSLFVVGSGADAPRVVAPLSTARIHGGRAQVPVPSVRPTAQKEYVCVSHPS